MKLKGLSGRIITKNCFKYLIKWDKDSRSKLQTRAKQLFKPLWVADVVFEEFPVFGTKLKLDFFNATRHIAIEVNGPQHDKFNKFFHQNRYNFVKGIERDCRKMQWCDLNNIRLVQLIEKDLDSFNTLYNKIYQDI